MTADTTSRSLHHVDFESLTGLTLPWRQLGAEACALGWVRLEAGQGATFQHTHETQEEVYVVLEGAAEMVVDGDLLRLERGDHLRLAPQVKRALRAAADSPLFMLVVGAAGRGWPRSAASRTLIDDGEPDFETLPPWIEDEAAARATNAAIAARMGKARRGE